MLMFGGPLSLSAPSAVLFTTFVLPLYDFRITTCGREFWRSRHSKIGKRQRQQGYAEEVENFVLIGSRAGGIRTDKKSACQLKSADAFCL
jgi:hypothetical protein